jgi:hypothetical protein
MNAIWMLDSQTGYAGSQSGLIYVTHDGGQNWNFHGVAGGSIRDIFFPPESDTGFVCCANSSSYFIIKPEEVIAKSIPYNVWEGISATSDGVWICGGTSIILVVDGEINWQSANVHGYWTSIFFVDNDYGWAGNGGLIDGFIDPDVPWSRVLDTEDTHSYSIHAIDKDHVWVALLDGRIMHTNNGSEYGFDTITSYMWSDVEWEVQAHPYPNTDLLAIQFTSPNNGYTVGHKNVILKYTAVSAITDNTIQDLDFEVYPNPCSDKIQITNYKIQNNLKFKTQNSKLIIVDILGKTVFEEEMGGAGDGEISVDVSHLTSGLYLVKLQTEEAVGVRKIIIK